MEYNSTQARNGARQGLTPGDRATGVDMATQVVCRGLLGAFLRASVSNRYSAALYYLGGTRFVIPGTP